MRTHLKWILIGLGFMFGLQVVISLVFTGISYEAAREPLHIMAEKEKLALITFGAIIGAYLIGGFVVGWLNERPRLIDSLIAAAVTLALTALIYASLSPGNRSNFVSGEWMTDTTGRIALSSQGMLLIAIAFVATIAGTLLGYLRTVPDTRISRAAALVGLLGSIIGPVALLVLGQLNLPFYVLAIILLLVMAFIGAGYAAFKRDPRHMEEISIMPERAVEQAQRKL